MQFRTRETLGGKFVPEFSDDGVNWGAFTRPLRGECGRGVEFRVDFKTLNDARDFLDRKQEETLNIYSK